jgi:predicted PurR-regulated permease PerM
MPETHEQNHSIKERREISISSETIFKVIIVGLFLFLLWLIRDIVILILIAVTIASALEPLVAALHRKKIPRVASVLTVYILAILFVLLIGYLVLPMFLSQFKELAANSDQLGTAFRNKLLQAGIWPQSQIGAQIIFWVKAVTAQLSNTYGNVFQTTVNIFNVILDIITILVISFYLVAEQNGMKAAIISVVPKEHQARTLDIVDKIQKKIGWWLIGQIIVSAVVFAMSFIGLSLLHVQYALVLAILAGFFELIPYIGPFISFVPAVVFAFAQSAPLALAVAILYLVIQKTEGYILVPKVMQKTVGLSPLVILVAILIGLKLAGIFGVFLAVPVAAAASVYIQSR